MTFGSLIDEKITDMNFSIYYSDGSRMACDYPGSYKEVLKSMLSADEWGFYIDNEEYKGSKISCFRFDKNNQCEFFEYTCVDGNVHRFYFEEPDYWKIYCGEVPKLHTVAFGSKAVLEFEYGHLDFLELRRTVADVYEVHMAMFGDTVAESAGVDLQQEADAALRSIQK